MDDISYPAYGTGLRASRDIIGPGAASLPLLTTCPGWNILSRGVPFLLPGLGPADLRVDGSEYPSTAGAADQMGSPLLDMCGTCLSILSTDGFSGYLAKLARAEQRYFANLWSINTESEPARVLARTSVSIQCYACRGNPRDSIKSNAEDIKMRITLRLFMTVTRELCIGVLPSFYKGKQVRAARQPLSKLR